MVGCKEPITAATPVKQTIITERFLPQNSILQSPHERIQCFDADSNVPIKHLTHSNIFEMTYTFGKCVDNGSHQCHQND